MSIRLGEDEHVGESDTEKINVVPLADLSLVLLIILMVMSPMIMQSMIQVLTPQVSKKQSAKKSDAPDSEPLMIVIRRNGITLNNTPVASHEDLSVQITSKLTEDPLRPVLITAEPDLPVDEVVQILDLARQSGAEKVSLLKQPEAGS